MRYLGSILAAGVLAAGAGSPLPADQATFDGADWFEREIGEGVVWRAYEFEDLFGARQSVSYLEVDLNVAGVEVELPYLQGSLQRTSQLVPSQVPDAIAATNGTYFTGQGGGGHNTYLRIDDTVVPHNDRTKGAWGHHGGFAHEGDEQWEIIEMPGTANEWDDNTTHPTIMANGPLLVLNGTVAQAEIDSAGGTHCTGRHPRTAVGVTADDRLILLTTDGRTERATGTTCNETADILLWLDVENALNMDGGGTTTMWVDGEPQNGVVNYPSDGTGERVTANAIAVIAPPADPVDWDARLLSMTYDDTIEPEVSQTVTLQYENVGTETWTQGDTRLVTSRPVEEASDLYEDGWVSPSEPALMEPATVAPGETATFEFPVTSPDTDTAETYSQFFMLTQDGVGRIGPHDGRAWLRLTVIPMTPVGESFIVESRSTGQNYLWYSEDGDWADSTATATAPGLTATGSRWTSTFTSVVDVRTATSQPDFPEAGEYHVSVAWPDAGTTRQDNIVYHVDHVGGRDTIHLDQSAPGDQWYPLGIFEFAAGQSEDGQVVLSNEDADVSGNMWSSGVRFVLIEDETTVEDWTLY